MKIVQCPDTFSPDFSKHVSVFLAGGITGTGDWQDWALGQFGADADLSASDNYVFVNPRRESFDITDPSASDFQITWEYDHLVKCEAALFWFPPETMCPITLYELGKWSVGNRPLFVGCHPAYARRFDVIKQTSLIRPQVQMHDTLSDLIADVTDYMLAVGRRRCI